jgi:shikimate kinase
MSVVSPPDRPSARTVPCIALIGLMASGKSTVGRTLARRLGVRFVDTDVAIEQATGRTVRELWEEGGEARYRPLERDAVATALGSSDPIVLAVPGGVAVDDAMADTVAASGAFVVYLRATPATLTARVEGTGEDHRPLLGDAPGTTLARFHRERDRRYVELADLVIDVDDTRPADISSRIAARLPT